MTIRLLVLAGILMSAALAATLGDRRPDMALLSAQQRIKAGGVGMPAETITFAHRYARIVLAPDSNETDLVCVRKSGQVLCLSVQRIVEIASGDAR